MALAGIRLTLAGNCRFLFFLKTISKPSQSKVGVHACERLDAHQLAAIPKLKICHGRLVANMPALASSAKIHLLQECQRNSPSHVVAASPLPCGNLVQHGRLSVRQIRPAFVVELEHYRPPFGLLVKMSVPRRDVASAVVKLH